MAGRDTHDLLSRGWKLAGGAPRARTPARSRISSHGPQGQPAGEPVRHRRGSLLTGHWARPPARGRRRARPARPRRTCPPCRLRSRRCPRRGRSSCLAAAPEARAQARHSPMSAARRPPQSPPLAWARQAGTRALGGTRPRAVPGAPFSGGRTGTDAARPRHPAQQPSLPGECPILRLRAREHVARASGSSHRAGGWIAPPSSRIS